MQRPLWIELAKQAPDIFWRTHQKLLEDLAKAALEYEAQHDHGSEGGLEL